MGYLVFTEEYVPKKVKIQSDEIRTYVLYVTVLLLILILTVLIVHLL